MFKSYFWEPDDEDYRGDDSRFRGLVNVEAKPFDSHQRFNCDESKSMGHKDRSVARKDIELDKDSFGQRNR